MRRGRPFSMLVIAGVAAALLTPAIAVATSRPASVPARDWTTYHHDRLRTGDGAISGTYTRLVRRFTWHVPVAGDRLFASPLAVGTTAYVTSLGNRVYAVSTRTGKTLWSRKLGTPYAPPDSVCGNIRPNIGITSTPVIDEGRSELFAVAALGTGAGAHTPVHRLFGLSLKDGRVLLSRVVDPPGQDAHFLLQRVSLALSKGHVIVGFGGNWGDCGAYHGWVQAVPESGTGAIARFEVASGAGQGRGAVWMGGAAPTVDASGNVYVATGNGNATQVTDAYDNSDAVEKLSPSMQLLDWFAPTTWYSDNAADLDLGSGAPQLLANGMLLQVGKTETAYVLRASSLGHLGAAAATFPVCVGQGQANGGDAIAGTLVVIPCEGGLNAVHVTASPPGGSVAWTTGATNGPPVVAAGLVWSIAGSPSGSTLYALNPATGAVRFQASIGGEANHFPTPAIGDGQVLVATSGTLVAFPPR